jgi:integrase/recombinase XerD
MGRYPLRTAIREYMNATTDYYAPKTLQDRRIVLLAIDREYAREREENPKLRAEPRNWGEQELTTVMLALKRRGLAQSSQSQELRILNGLLHFVENNVMDRMKAKAPHVFPKPQHERKPSLNDEQLAKVLTATEETKGWRGECMRFMMATYALTGLRLNELRMAEYSDLDLKNWTIRVSHPKGERTYGRQRVVPIPEPLKPTVLRFLRERERVLTESGLLGVRPLVFVEGNPEQPVAIQTVESWASEVRVRSGVAFSVHTLRRTYGQNLLNRGVGIESVSVALGHSSTLTTEKHYCRKDSDSARLEIAQAYQRSENVSLTKSRIERDKYLAGYA